MHPGMFAWWKQARRHAECGAPAGCGPSGEHAGWGHGWGGGEHAYAGGGDSEGDFGGGTFGVRRPLRFLAHKLELEEKQVAELARVLNELKTERAQAAVDHRRTVAGFADAISAEAFNAETVAGVAAERVKSAERLRDALVKALERIHALLNPEQRARFAYLIRTGALSL
jgi:Spy/CpxP family protein refolding chaperone